MGPGGRRIRKARRGLSCDLKVDKDDDYSDTVVTTMMVVD